MGPSKDDFGRFEPLAMTPILPVALVKNVTICDVSEKSTARMQIAVSLVIGFLDSDAFYFSGFSGTDSEFQIFIIEGLAGFRNIAQV